MTPLPKNSEGYPDPTAEYAIGKADKDMNTTNEFYPGDIWRCKRNDGKDMDTYIILAVHDKYATTLKLYDTPSYSNNLEVKADGLMYADTGRLSWVFLDTCKDFIRCMNPKELETLRNSVAKALNIIRPVLMPEPAPTKTTVAEVVVGPDPELKTLIEKLNRVELAVLDNKAVDDLTEQNIRLSAQLEVYKGLYEKVLTGKFCS
jgi:hypothetical protein